MKFKGGNAIDPEERLRARTRYLWKTAAEEGKDWWSVCLTIPLAHFGIESSSGLKPWRINVGRKAGHYNKRENSCWSPSVSGGDDINPADFGWMIFE